MRAVLIGVVMCALGATGCAAELPEGTTVTIDTSAWSDSPACSDQPCTLDAYATRDFTSDAVVPAALVDGTTVRVHCFVPTPAPVSDPRGREAYRWYLLTVGSMLLWAPDIALTSDEDVRRSPDEPGDHLAAGLQLCHSGVPGR